MRIAVGALLASAIVFTHSGCISLKSKETAEKPAPPIDPVAIKACAISPATGFEKRLEVRDRADFPVFKKEDFPEKPTIDDLVDKIQEKGLVGLIHGIDRESELYVFTFNVPKSFFKRFNISLVTLDQKIKERFRALNRGDRVFVKGALKTNRGQPHLYTEQVELITRYQPDAEHPRGEFERNVSVPCVLEKQKRVRALVHAVGKEKGVLVLDYLDTVFPIFTSDLGIFDKVYRGDIIETGVRPMKIGRGPKHFETIPGTLRIAESLVKLHETEVEFTGRLTLFPESPTINRDIWAVEHKLPSGHSRYYTLVNFEDMSEFEAISEKMRKHWDRNKGASFKGRGKFINQIARVRVKGKFNLVSKAQANAQIYTTANDIEVFE